MVRTCPVAQGHNGQELRVLALKPAVAFASLEVVHPQVPTLQRLAVEPDVLRFTQMVGNGICVPEHSVNSA